MEPDVATQTFLPVGRKTVPPVAKGFLLVDFSGVDAGDLEAVVLTVEVNLDEAVLDVVDALVVDGLGGQMPCQRGLKEGGAVVAGIVGDALQIELEGGPFEEEVDVLQVGIFTTAFTAGTSS